jgi:hypothetical protein
VRQLVVASTFYQCMSLAAAAEAGVLPDADERVLVLATSSQAPELTADLQDQQGFARVAARFDRVVDLARLLYPRRPVQFAPRDVEVLTWQRLLRSHWELADDRIQILMDSVQVNPALALARIFDEADLYVHSDGLMTYSPTRKQLPRHLSQRLVGLVCVDLVPGLSPNLLAEEAVTHLVVPADSVRQLLKEVTELGDGPDPTDRDHRPTALILGQYLSSLQLLTGQQESELYCRMMVEAALRGAEVCRFKPHPSSPPTMILELEQQAARLGMDLTVDTSTEIAEITICRSQPRWVISCFSTGLATARYLLGVEAVAIGARELLNTLSPYQNSNRVPLVLAEVLFTDRAIGGCQFQAPDETEFPNPRLDLQQLIDAVAYCMQPILLPHYAGAAADYLTLVVDEPELLSTVFRRRRLTALDLPGALPAPSLPVQLRRRVEGVARRFSGGPSR